MIIIIIIIYSCDLFAAIGSFIYYFVLNSNCKGENLSFYFFIIIIIIIMFAKEKRKEKGWWFFKGLYPLPSFAEQHASDSLLSCLFYLVTSAQKKTPIKL